MDEPAEISHGEINLLVKQLIGPSPFDMAERGSVVMDL
jgi:hypothetical protein